MKTEAVEIALDAVERAPEIGWETMGIVQDGSGQVHLLRQADALLEPCTRLLRTGGNPCKRDVGDEMVVFVKAAYVTVASGKQHFHDPLLLTQERIYALNEMEADHVTAWSNGGDTSEANCQMLCRHHNRVKGNA